jgi:cell shape-determining protein MreC
MNNQFTKVSGHETLVRDMSSRAIIANNDTEYESYRRSRENQKKQLEVIKTQTKEIESLKTDMQEIKQMLNLLIKGK